MWEKAENMFGAGSSASEEDCTPVERLMRKRVLMNLESNGKSQQHFKQWYYGYDV